MRLRAAIAHAACSPQRARTALLHNYYCGWDDVSLAHAHVDVELYRTWRTTAA